MTKLAKIEIDGYKGLEGLEYHPENINLITGRNNTGKTSFLEAVDLLFNPSDITRFGENVDTLVNVDRDSATITGTVDGNSINLNLREPTNEEAGQFFVEAAIRRLTNINQTFYIHSDFEKREVFREAFRNALRRALNKNISDANLSNIKDGCVVLCVNGEDYPYVHIGNVGSGLLLDAYKDLSSELIEELGDSFTVTDPDDNFGEISIQYKGEDGVIVETGLPRYFLRDGIFIEKPDSLEDVNFIESADLVKGVEESDEEKDAIKIDDIGDYIKEKELVDDLKVFDLDQLVFEREGGSKYRIPYDFMGDGFKTIVGLLWELIDTNNKYEIVLIEEPENHMHPGYLRELVYFLIRIAKEDDIQLFITTHNSDFINSFFTENLTDEEEEYLEKEFSLIRMEEDTAVVQDYKTAKDDLKNLHLDLRGI